MTEDVNKSTPLRARGRGKRLTSEERAAIQQTFLASFRKNANITLACRVAGIHRSMIYRWQEHSDIFSFEFKEAEQEANDMLLQAAWQRAVEGTLKPCLSMGKQVYVGGEPLYEKVYSDSLLSLLMKARMPSYRDSSKVEITKPGGVEIYEPAAVIRLPNNHRDD